MVDNSQTKHRSIQVPHSSSLIVNNLASADGKQFVTFKNTEKGGQISVYGHNLVDGSADQVAALSALIPNPVDCTSVKIIKI